MRGPPLIRATVGVLKEGESKIIPSRITPARNAAAPYAVPVILINHLSLAISMRRRVESILHPRCNSFIVDV